MKEQYLQSVRALMDCPAGERERLVARLGQAVAAYLDDVPEAGEAELFANFGTPEACAARLMQECPPEALAAERRRMVRRHRRTVAILSVLLAAALAVAVYLWSNGGLVIIQSGNAVPESIRNQPDNTVIYDYDD